MGAVRPTSCHRPVSPIRIAGRMGLLPRLLPSAASETSPDVLSLDLPAGDADAVQSASLLGSRLVLAPVVNRGRNRARSVGLGTRVVVDRGRDLPTSGEGAETFRGSGYPCRFLDLRRDVKPARDCSPRYLCSCVVP